VDELPVLAERFRGASAEPGLAGRLGVSEEQLVSIDFRGDPRSSIVDIPLLARPGAHLVRVAAWYDNEWGYASRLAELLRLWADEPGATAGTP
jgi:glyceraldehyde 3-phosphate dehydrogenase